MRDAIGYIQYRDALQDRFPLRVGSSRRIAALTRWLARFDTRQPPYPRPTPIHNTLWQAALMWTGRGGEYSAGSAFCARVPTGQVGR
jgi:hypothetical protein